MALCTLVGETSNCHALGATVIGAWRIAVLFGLCFVGAALWKHAENGRYSAHYTSALMVNVLDTRTGEVRFISLNKGLVTTANLDSGLIQEQRVTHLNADGEDEQTVSLRKQLEELANTPEKP